MVHVDEEQTDGFDFLASFRMIWRPKQRWLNWMESLLDQDFQQVQESSNHALVQLLEFRFPVGSRRVELLDSQFAQRLNHFLKRCELKGVKCDEEVCWSVRRSDWLNVCELIENEFVELKIKCYWKVEFVGLKTLKRLKHPLQQNNPIHPTNLLLPCQFPRWRPWTSLKLEAASMIVDFWCCRSCNWEHIRVEAETD